MRTHKLVLAAVALSASAATVITAAPQASAAPRPFTPGTLLVADQGVHTGAAGLFAIAPDGSKTTLFDTATVVDVAVNAAGDVFGASCNLHAIVKVPVGAATWQWQYVASTQTCPTAVAVEPSGSVVYSADGAIWRTSADGSGSPVVAVQDQTASSLAVDDNGDIWFADGGGNLGVAVAGSEDGVLIRHGDENVRSVRFGAGHTLVTAGGYAQDTAQWSADLVSVTDLGTVGGFASGAVVHPSTGFTSVADDTNHRIVSVAPDGSQSVLTSALDDPRGLAQYPAIVSAHRTESTTTITSHASRTPGTVFDPVTLRASVAPAARSGLVQFSIDGQPLGDAVAVKKGAATLRTTLPAGASDVVATFLGNGAVAPSRSAAVRYTATVEPTSTTLTTSTPSTTPQNEDVQLSMDVTAVHGVPDGLVEIQQDGETIAAAPLDADGHADLAVTLPPGVQQLRAVYFGDGSYFSGSRSKPLTFELTTPYAPSVSSSVTTGTVDQEGTVPVDIAVAVVGVRPGAVPTGTVTADSGFTCGSLAPVRGLKAVAHCTGSVQPGFHEVALGYSGDATYGTVATSATVWVFGGGDQG